MRAFVAWPFRLQTARELAFLLLGGLTAIVGFVIQVVGLSVGLSLLITLVGIPVLLALAVADRWLCGRAVAHRLRPPGARSRRLPSARPARLHRVDEDGRD